MRLIVLLLKRHDLRRSRPISFLFEERNGSWTPKKVDQRKGPLDSSLKKWSLREKPGSTLSKWDVPWVHRIPLVRYAVLLTGIVPRTSPRLAGRLTRQRRERSRSVKQTCHWHVCSVGRSNYAARRAVGEYSFSSAICSAERGWMRDKGIVVLTDQKSCPLSARERFRHGKCNPRPAALFFLTPGAARSFFSGKSRKERMGGALRRVSHLSGT